MGVLAGAVVGLRQLYAESYYLRSSPQEYTSSSTKKTFIKTYSVA